MKYCPSCNKKIVVRVSGKYTCSCGEIIRLVNESNELVESTPQPNHIKEWVLNFNESIILCAVLLCSIAVFAWDSDFPDLFGKYSGSVWTVVTYMLLVSCLLFLIFLVYLFYIGISEKNIGVKSIISLICLMVVDFVVFLYFLNEVGLIEVEIPIIGNII